MGSIHGRDTSSIQVLCYRAHKTTNQQANKLTRVKTSMVEVINPQRCGCYFLFLYSKIAATSMQIPDVL